MADLPRSLTATAEIVLTSPDEVMLRICRHFREFGDVKIDGRCSRIETSFGIAGFEACEGCLKVSAEGIDDTALAFVKLSVAEHLLNLAKPEAPKISWQGDNATGQPLPYFREMRVVGTRFVTPRMKRITLAGHDLARFAAGGMHIRLLFPKSQAVAPSWPVMGEDGRPLWPTGDSKPDIRVYTIRRIDVSNGEVDVDFVMHEGAAMPGADFGAAAKIGDVLGMTGPGGGGAKPADWYLLAGDETALPAISRILEELPETAQAVVRIEVQDEAEIQSLNSNASVDLQWLSRNGRDAGTIDLLTNAVRAVEFPMDGRRVFAWAGCEFTQFKAIRTYLRGERKLERDDHLVVAYWRKGIAGDEARRDSRDD